MKRKPGINLLSQRLFEMLTNLLPLVTILTCFLVTFIQTEEIYRSVTFCGDGNSITEIFISDGHSVFSGSIYSPDYPNNYGNMSDTSDCIVRFTGLGSHYIVLEHLRQNNRPGPCLTEDLSIATGEQNNPCETLNKTHTDNQRPFLDITLHQETIALPAFYIYYKVYPLYRMDAREQARIDTAISPVGYIMDGQAASLTQTLSLTNFPETATLTIDIQTLNLTTLNSAYPAEFLMATAYSPFVLRRSIGPYSQVSRKYQPLNRNVTFEVTLTGAASSAHGPIAILKFTVRSCPIHIDNVISLTSIHSTQYKAICKAGYHLDGSSSFYECKDGAWKPQIQCRMNITETIGKSTPVYTDEGNQMNYSLLVTLSVAIGITILGLIITGVSLFRNRASKLSVQNNLSNCGHIPRDISNSASSHTKEDYDMIDEVDPYLNYCEINDRDIIPDLVSRLSNSLLSETIDTHSEHVIGMKDNLRTRRPKRPLPRTPLLNQKISSRTNSSVERNDNSGCMTSKAAQHIKTRPHRATALSVWPSKETSTTNCQTISSSISSSNQFTTVAEVHRSSRDDERRQNDTPLTDFRKTRNSIKRNNRFGHRISKTYQRTRARQHRASALSVWSSHDASVTNSKRKNTDTMKPISTLDQADASRLRRSNQVTTIAEIRKSTNDHGIRTIKPPLRSIEEETRNENSVYDDNLSEILALDKTSCASDDGDSVLDMEL